MSNSHSGSAPSQTGRLAAIAGAFVRPRPAERFPGRADAETDEIAALNAQTTRHLSLASAVAWATCILPYLMLPQPALLIPVLAFLNICLCLVAVLRVAKGAPPQHYAFGLLAGFLLTSVASIFFGATAMQPFVGVMPLMAALAWKHVEGIGRLIVLASFAGASLFLATGLGDTMMRSNLPRTAHYDVVIELLWVTSSVYVVWILSHTRDQLLKKLRAARDQIVAATARSETALETARVGLFDVPDLDVREVCLSESFTTICGYSAREILAQLDNPQDLVHPEDLDEVMEALSIWRQRRTRLRLDLRLKTRSGDYRWFSLRARFVASPVGAEGISGSLQDIHFVKLAEAALRSGRDRAIRAEKAKSDFIAVMSHEVRTPLNALLGSVSLLRRQEHDAPTLDLLAMADEAGKGLLAVVNDILDISRIEAGKIVFAPEPTEIVGLLGRMVGLWRSEAETKGLEVTLEIHRLEAAWVMLDPDRTRQIVGNLLANAIKYTDRGHVRITLGVFVEVPDQAKICIDIVDTGPGIAEDFRDRLFEPFVRPSTCGRGGAGLGLSISRNLARQMGGDIAVVSTSPAGSHFQVQLLAPVAADRLEHPAAAASPALNDFRVLCVDDNEANRRIATLLLEAMGAEIETCASGEEALLVCAHKRFDIILMDIVMPGMDGCETLLRLRCIDGPNRHAPVLAVTARLSHDDLTLYEAAGFDGVVGKPLDIGQLAVAILNHVPHPVPAVA